MYDRLSLIADKRHGNSINTTLVLWWRAYLVTGWYSIIKPHGIIEKIHLSKECNALLFSCWRSRYGAVANTQPNIGGIVILFYICVRNHPGYQYEKGNYVDRGRIDAAFSSPIAGIGNVREDPSRRSLPPAWQSLVPIRFRERLRHHQCHAVS